MNSEPPFDRVLILGAGAIAGSWVPVIRALDLHSPLTLSPSGASSYLARQVYFARFLHANGAGSESVGAEQSRQKLSQIKHAIVRELVAAESRNEIHVQPEFDAVMERYGPRSGERVLALTLNWDTVAVQALQRRAQNCDFLLSVHHLHGSVADPDGLYLPSETFFEAHREESRRQAYYKLHDSSWRAIASAPRLLIYGAGIDPLDAELGQTIALGLDRSGEHDVTIVDPSRKLVAHRVLLHLYPTDPVRVAGAHPAALSDLVEYEHTRSDPRAGA